MGDTKSQSPATPTPLETFFVGFAAVGFSYQPATSALKNFARLCKVSGWVGNSPARTDARKAFNDALVQQFNFLYGVDGNDLAAWHKLCKTIGIEPVPDCVDECRKVGARIILVTSLCSKPRLHSLFGTHMSTSSISSKPSQQDAQYGNSTPSTNLQHIRREQIDSSQNRTHTRVDYSRNCYARSPTPTLGRGGTEAKREKQGRLANGKRRLQLRRSPSTIKPCR